MILKCPQCGEEYEVTSNNEKIENFNMKCQSCGARINSEEHEEIEVRRLSEEKDYVTIPNKKSSSGCLWAIVIIVVLIGVLAITKPDRTKHAEKIRTECMQYVTRGEDKMGERLTLLIAPTIIDLFLNGGLIIDDYLIFNVGRVKYQDVDRVLTVGALNNVYMFPLPNSSDLESVDY